MTVAQLALFAGGFAAGMVFVFFALGIAGWILDCWFQKLEDPNDYLTDGDEYPATIIRRGK